MDLMSKSLVRWDYRACPVCGELTGKDRPDSPSFVEHWDFVWDGDIAVLRRCAGSGLPFDTPASDGRKG